MVRLKQVIISGAIGLAILAPLAGCNSTSQPPSASSTGGTTATDATKAGFDGLRQVITNTKGAVQAGDFAKAKTEFDQFETFWREVENGVKAKASGTYDAIEQNMDQISGELKASQPNQANILTALQSLETNVNSAAN